MGDKRGTKGGQKRDKRGTKGGQMGDKVNIEIGNTSTGRY